MADVSSLHSRWSVLQHRPIGLPQALSYFDFASDELATVEEGEPVTFVPARESAAGPSLELQRRQKAVTEVSSAPTCTIQSVKGQTPFNGGMEGVWDLQ